MWEIFFFLKIKKSQKKVCFCPNCKKLLILIVKVWTLFGQFLSKWTLNNVQYAKKQERPLISDFQVPKVEISPTSLYSR